jgi:hypothetical protein
MREGSHAGVAGLPRLGNAPVSWKINPKEVQTLRHGSREDHEEFLMDIETVIGRFREGRLGRHRVVGRPKEAARGLAAMLAGDGRSRCVTECQPQAARGPAVMR